MSEKMPLSNQNENIDFVIVTPSFNQGRFIKQTIDSVFAQKKVTIVYIVVDGGSDDETISILKRYTDRLFWSSQKDHGQTDALNKGITKGLTITDKTIIAYINSDDYYMPDVFIKVRSLFEKHKEKMWLVGDSHIVDEDGKKTQKYIQAYKRFFRSILRFPILLILNPIPQPSVFIRSQAFQEIGLFDVKLSYTMDYEYWLRLFREYGSPIKCNKVLSSFRIQENSKGTTQFTKQFKEEYSVAKRYTKSLPLLLAHKLHSSFVVCMYRILK